jgi:siroheme synthase
VTEDLEDQVSLQFFLLSQLHHILLPHNIYEQVIAKILFHIRLERLTHHDSPPLIKQAHINSRVLVFQGRQRKRVVRLV